MRQKTNILITTTSFPRWEGDLEGGGNFVLSLCKELQKQFNVSVLTPYVKGTATNNRIEGIDIYRYKFLFCRSGNLINKSGIAETLSQQKWKFLFVPFLLIAQLFAIKKICEKKQCKVINAHWLVPQGFIAGLYKKFFNKDIKIVSTSHGSDLNMSFGRIGNKLLQFIAKQTDRLTVVSNELKEKAKKAGFRNDIAVIHMGIDINRFRPHQDSETLRKRLGISNGMLLFVGFFNEVKGIEYIIEAMPEILAQKPDTKLVLVGDGVLKAKLRQSIEEKKLTNHVTFTGFIKQDELPRYYSAADIVLMPSLSEGSPVVLPEALSCGATVITSDLPVYRQHIKDGETGFIVTRKSAKEISQKVLHILRNPQLSEKIKNNARRYVEKRFDWKIIGDKYADVIKSL